MENRSNKKSKKYVLKEKYKKLLKNVLFFIFIIISLLYFFNISIILYTLYYDIILLLHILFYIIIISIITYQLYKNN